MDARARLPELLSPRESAVVDASDVTFRWIRVPRASEYRIEISTDHTFDDVRFVETVEGTTQLTVRKTFEPSGRTLYWRVLFLTEDGWNGGESIESFIAASSADAAAHVEVPDQREEFGPLPGLVSSGSPAQYLSSAEYDASSHGVENESVEVGPIVKMVGQIAAFLVIAIVVLFQLSAKEFRSAERVAAEMTGYPLLRETEAAGISKLTQYRVIDAQQGIYQIPVDRAIALIAEEQRTLPAGEYSPVVILKGGE